MLEHGDSRGKKDSQIWVSVIPNADKVLTLHLIPKTLKMVTALTLYDKWSTIQQVGCQLLNDKLLTKVKDDIKQ